MSLFCDRFRQLKEESGLTLKELSKQIDISVPNLSYYMTGREPSYDIFIKIADHFNVTTDWLVGRSASRTPVVSDTITTIETRLCVPEDKKLSGEALRMYNEVEERILRILSILYLYNSSPRQKYVEDCNSTLISVITMLEQILVEFYNFINTNITGESATKFIKSVNQRSDFISKLLQITAIMQIFFAINDDTVSDDNTLTLQTIFNLYFDEEEIKGTLKSFSSLVNELCILREPSASFAELNGRGAELNGR